MTSPIRSEAVATSTPGEPTRLVLTEATHKRIEQERDQAGDDWRAIALYRDYARGIHPGTLTSEQQRTLRMLVSGVHGRVFADNLCKVILRSATDRLAVERFAVDPVDTTEAAKTAASDVADYLAGVMARNGGGALQNRVHYAVIRDGNTAISLRWDNARQTVRLRPEPWWDGSSGVWFAYDSDGEPEYAVRDWVTYELATDSIGRVSRRPVTRRVVWWPDRIERYRKSGQGWQPAPMDVDIEAGRDDGTGIVKWVRADGRPLGIPVVHFAANADDDDAYGVSDLAGGVLGLQDEINDLQRSVTGAARHAGFPMYFASGVKAGTTMEVEPGMWLTIPDPAARAVVLAPGEIGPLLDAYNLKVKAVCRMTGTPEHQITGVWPSGEALLRAEIALVQRVERLQDLEEGPWTTVAHRSTELHNAFGRGTLDEDALIRPEWSSADRRDPLSVAQIQDAEATALQKIETLRTAWALQQAGVPDDAVQDIVELNDMDAMDATGQV